MTPADVRALVVDLVVSVDLAQGLIPDPGDPTDVAEGVGATGAETPGRVTDAVVEHCTGTHGG